MSYSVAAHAYGLRAAAQVTANPIIIGIVKAIEGILDQIVVDPTAKMILQAIEAWVNSLLAGAVPTNPALTAMHDTAAKAKGPFIGVLIKLIENLIGGLAGNPQMLQAIIAFIQQILGHLPQPTP